MSLQNEIDKKASTISKDSYQMSIGELINLYRDNELDIHPEFQRVFRWNDYQKTKLIESIMLNIPIPSIFVNQNEDGVWDIIDGVQRLSTIFQFVGVFKDDNDNVVDPLELQGTDYLPSFKGIKWASNNKKLCFTKEQQLFFKRARLDVIIMKKESDSNTKYELFQRLNTGGSLLSGQEVRNCLMIMANKDFYELISQLDEIDSFQECLPITDRKSDEQYRKELIIRLMVAKNMDRNSSKKYSDLSELLDKETIELCQLTFNNSDVLARFKNTFDLLKEVMGEDAFRRFENDKHRGPVLASAFQVIATGIYEHIEEISNKANYTEWVQEKIHNLYKEETFINNLAKGVRSIPRFYDLSIYGVEYFRP